MENTSYVNKARLVRIEKQNHVDREYRFSQDSFDRALTSLSKNAFAFWCYCAKNTNGFMLNISRQVVTRLCGFSDSTYTRAFDELRRKGYIAKSGDGYRFYEDGFLKWFLWLVYRNFRVTNQHVYFLTKSFAFWNLLILMYTVTKNRTLQYLIVLHNDYRILPFWF